MEFPPGTTPDVFCADIGSVERRRFGWARIRPSTTLEKGDDILELVTQVSACLRGSGRAALGFTCPLFVPVAVAPTNLTRARAGEGSRAWSAVAGAGALAAGLAEVAWILQHIRAGLPTEVPCCLSLEAFAALPKGILLWEAFLAVRTSPGSHAEEALRAARAFVDPRSTPGSALEQRKDEETLSLVGAALLWSGWCSDPAVLKEPCLVVKV